MIDKQWLYDRSVSRETIERLEIYASLLEKWNTTINLVAPSTLPTLWSRHIFDSFQVTRFLDDSVGKWCDMGSGGGFPGLVVAITSAESHPNQKTVCIESDLRKATFLRTVARETEVNLQVTSSRIESAEPQKADIVSARALSSLTNLLTYAQRHLAESGRCVFLKGENYEDEVKEALEVWKFQLNTYHSETNPNSIILEIGDIRRD
jgi:16S rRNA (guanine527-N7)-methyltransferase